MSTIKAPKKGYVKGVGNRSTKRSGTISTSLRMTVADNKKFHSAAKCDNRSFNVWAYLTLMREADRILKNANKIPGDGPTAKAMRAASRGEAK